jgi:peptidoglycan/LPS O-acetylase OafA/YrhL
LRGLAVASLAFLIIAAVWVRSDHRYLTSGCLSLVALATASVILGLVLAPSRGTSWVLESPPMVEVGRISYGLYLWNFPATYILVRPGLPWIVNVSLQVGFTFAAALFSYYVVERPFLRLKGRFTVAETPEFVSARG